jgi:hypothetical protein
MTMQEMLALGAPRLPEGMFYRVRCRSGQMFGNGWSVEVRESRKGFGSRFWASQTCDNEVKVWDDETQTTWHWEDISPERSIKDAATAAWLSIQVRKTAHLKHRADHLIFKSLEGDHR